MSKTQSSIGVAYMARALLAEERKKRVVVPDVERKESDTFKSLNSNSGAAILQQLEYIQTEFLSNLSAEAKENIGRYLTTLRDDSVALLSFPLNLQSWISASL